MCLGAQLFPEVTMQYNDYKHIGRQFRQAVHDAVHTGNIEEIGQTVEDSVHEIADDVADEVNGVFDILKGTGRHSPRQAGMPHGGHFDGPDSSGHERRNPAFRSRMPGAISGTVEFVIGLCLFIPFAITDIAVFVVSVVNGHSIISQSVFADTMWVVSICAAGAFILFAHGIVARRRARRFARYRDAIGGAAFCTVENLAELAGETQERTKNDLKKMVTTGACPQGHFDRSGTCFLVDDETYDAYLEAEKTYSAKKQAEKAEEQKKQENATQGELDEVEQEGISYLKQIRTVNDALPGKEISDRLDKLENVTGRIFACIRQHPKKLPDIRSFMHYYLPTTLKLVKSYQEFESQPVKGKNITQAESDIEHALDTINTAFGNLLDNLYADDALDISSDISALETMLRQGGLTGSDFEKKPDGSSHPQQKIS